MNLNMRTIVGLAGVFLLAVVTPPAVHAQQKPGALDHIFICKGTEMTQACKNFGIPAPHLVVGDEITVTAWGFDEKGNDVPIWPTWKADKELSLTVVVGRSKTVTIRALKEAVTVFFEAVYITDDGKKVTGLVGGDIKPKK